MNVLTHRRAFFVCFQAFVSRECNDANTVAFLVDQAGTCIRYTHSHAHAHRPSSHKPAKGTHTQTTHARPQAQIQKRVRTHTCTRTGAHARTRTRAATYAHRDAQTPVRAVALDPSMRTQVEPRLCDRVHGRRVLPVVRCSVRTQLCTHAVQLTCGGCNGGALRSSVPNALLAQARSITAATASHGRVTVAAALQA